MSDSVKFIFMTLIKVPVIIFVSYFILNIFAFFFIYFKVLGMSYIVMQEVAENNYLTESQINQFNESFEGMMNTPMVADVRLIVGKEGDNVVCIDSAGASGTYTYVDANNDAITPTPGTLATQKTQYGQSKTVGILCRYEIIWPLSYNQSMGGTQAVNGVSGDVGNSTNIIQTTYNGAGDSLSQGTSLEDGDNFDASGTELSDVTGRHSIIRIGIHYEVPGLKYYADLT